MTPVVVVLGTLMLQGALYLLLVRPLGIAGLSWGAVIAGWAQLLVTLMLVSAREELSLAELLPDLLRVWLAAGIAAAITWFALPLTHFSGGWLAQLVALAVGAGVFGSVYAFVGWLLGVRELRLVVDRLRRRP